MITFNTAGGAQGVKNWSTTVKFRKRLLIRQNFEFRHIETRTAGTRNSASHCRTSPLMEGFKFSLL